MANAPGSASRKRSFSTVSGFANYAGSAASHKRNWPTGPE